MTDLDSPAPPPSPGGTGCAPASHADHPPVSQPLRGLEPSRRPRQRLDPVACDDRARKGAASRRPRPTALGGGSGLRRVPKHRRRPAAPQPHRRCRRGLRAPALGAEADDGLALPAGWRPEYRLRRQRRRRGCIHQGWRGLSGASATHASTDGRSSRRRAAPAFEPRETELFQHVDETRFVRPPVVVPP